MQYGYPPPLQPRIPTNYNGPANPNLIPPNYNAVQAQTPFHYVPPPVEKAYEKSAHPDEKAVDIVTKTFTINSRNRWFQFPDPNKYTFPLGEVLKNVTSVEIIDAAIPRSDYNISSRNNTIGVQEGVNPAILVTVPEGFYFNEADLATAVETALNASSLADTYTVTFDTATRKMTISATGPFILRFGASNPNPPDLDEWDTNGNFVRAGTTMRRVLGFYRQTLTGASTYTGQNMVDLFAQDKYITLHIPNLPTDGHLSNDPGAVGAICKFYFDDAEFHKRKIFVSGSYLQHTHKKLRPYMEKLDRLEIEWKTQDGDLYDFHGMDHVLTVQVTYQNDSYRVY